jgi:hypothetical protein
MARDSFPGYVAAFKEIRRFVGFDYKGLRKNRSASAQLTPGQRGAITRAWNAKQEAEQGGARLVPVRRRANESDAALKRRIKTVQGALRQRVPFNAVAVKAPNTMSIRTTKDGFIMRDAKGRKELFIALDAERIAADPERYLRELFKRAKKQGYAVAQFSHGKFRGKGSARTASALIALLNLIHRKYKQGESTTESHGRAPVDDADNDISAAIEEAYITGLIFR